VALAGAGAAMIAIGVLTGETFPAPFVAAARVAWRLFLLAVLLGAFAGWGTLLCRLLAVPRPSWIATTAAGAIATATVVGYLAPWWFPDALFTTPWLLAGWLLWLPALRERGSAAAAAAALATAEPTTRSEPSAPAGGAGWVPWLACLFFLQLPLAVALSPPVGLDSLVYHLGIPHQAALYGRLLPMPWLTFSSFPLHAEMLYGVTLTLDRGVLAQLLHLSAAAAAVVTAARLAAGAFGTAAAPWTALLLASAPLFNLTAGIAGSDWPLLLYVALALEQHARTAEHPAAERLEALFLGAAVATKYTALPTLVLLLLPWRRLSWRRVATQAALVLAVALPWYGRNLWLHHNPLHPFLGRSPAAAAISHYRGDAPLLERLRSYLFEPQLIDESVGLLLPAAMVIAAVMMPGRRLRPELPLVAMVYGAVLLVTHPTLRAFGPLLLVIAVVGGGGMAMLAATPGWRRALLAVVVVALPLHLVNMLVVWDYDGHRPLRSLAGMEDEARYLRPSQPYIDAYQALARHAPPAARVLVVGESRVFHLDRRAVYGSVVDPHPFTAFAGTPPDAAAALRRLRAAGIGYVVFSPRQQKVGVRPPGIRHERDHYAPADLDRAFRELLARHARPVFHRGNTWIYALAGGTDAAPSAAVPVVTPTASPPPIGASPVAPQRSSR
jgi:hypothetical protein